MKKTICMCFIIVILLSGCVGRFEERSANSSCIYSDQSQEIYIKNLGIQLQSPSFWTVTETPLWPQCLLDYDTDVQMSIDLLDEKLDLDLFTEDYFSQMYQNYFTSWEDKELGTSADEKTYYSIVESTSNYKKTDSLVRMSCYVRVPLFDDNAVTRSYHYYTTYIINVENKYSLLIRCEEVDSQYKYLKTFDMIVNSIQYYSEPFDVPNIESFDYWMKQGLIHTTTKNDVSVRKK